MGGYTGKETTSNGNLRSRSRVTKRHYWPQRVTTSRRNTAKEHGGSLPHQPGPEKRNPRRRSRTDPWEGGTATHTNACRSTQRQPEAGDPAIRPIGKPTRRRESKCHDRRLRKNTVPTCDRWPHREDQEHRRTEESRGTAAPRRQADKYLTENQGNNLRCQATEGGQPRINCKHPKPLANIGSERKESKKTPGAWTTKLQELPSETQDKGRRVPQKKAGTQAGPQPTNPSPNKRPKKKTQARKQMERVRPEAKVTERRNRDPRRAQHTGAAGGTTDLWPNHPNPRAGEGQTETWKGGLTTKGSLYSQLRS